LPYRVRVWTTEDGLPQNWVECIVQSRSGHLYVGTRSGLVRFDGTEFTAVAPAGSQPEFRQASCQALLEDGEGSLWIGTKQGLARWRHGSYEQFGQDTGLGSAEITALVESGGGLWIGTMGGLSRWERESGRFTTYGNRIRHGEMVRGLAAGASGELWVGSYAGLHGFDSATGQFFDAGAPGQGPVETGPEGVACLRLDRQGRLWWGTAGGLAWKDRAASDRGVRSGRESLARRVGSARVGVGAEMEGREDEPAGPLPELEAPPEVGWVQALLEDARGTLWVLGTGGVACWTRSGWVQPELSEATAGVTFRCAVEDREGNLWLGTQRHGLWRLRPQPVRMWDRRHGLCHDEVWSLCESRAGGVWVATSEGVARLWNGRFEAPAFASEAAGLSLRAVWEDRTGDLWLGAADRDFVHYHHTGGGYVRVAKPAVHPQTLAIYEDRAGAIWIGTKGGVMRLVRRPRDYQTAEGAWLHETHGEQWLYRPGEIRYLAEGEQWIGRQGVWWLDGDATGRTYPTAELGQVVQKAWTKEIPSGQLTSYVVHTLLEDRAGAMWFGTRGGGLNRLQGGAFRAYTTREGLSSDDVLALHEDADGTLWVGTRAGLTRVRPGRFGWTG